MLPAYSMRLRRKASRATWVLVFPGISRCRFFLITLGLLSASGGGVQRIWMDVEDECPHVCLDASTAGEAAGEWRIRRGVRSWLVGLDR